MRRMGRLLALLMAVVAMPAQAGSGDFARCDGFGPPDGGLDGINLVDWRSGKPARKVGLEEQPLVLGSAGAFLCDAALSDPLLTDLFWLRRARLLQFKAIHLIAAGKPEQAMAALDASDAVGIAHADPWFGGSVGLGNKAVRVWALYRLDRREDARAMLARVGADRPFAPSVAILARRLRTLFEGPETRSSVAEAPVMPELLAEAFWDALLGEDYARAVELSPQIAFAAIEGDSDWVLSTLGNDYRGELVPNRAAIGGATAYALAKLGRGDEARQRLRAAYDEVDASVLAPVPDRNGRVSRKDEEAHVQRGAVAVRAREILWWWEQAMKRGALPPAGERSRAESGIGVGPGPRPINDREPPRFELGELAARLPRPEAALLAPPSWRAGVYSRNTLGGFIMSKRPGANTVIFGTQTGSRAMAEEAALLAAAQVAQARGKDCLLVDVWFSYGRITQRADYYHSGYLGPSIHLGTNIWSAGHESQIAVRAFVSSELPTVAEASRWRLIPVQRVIELLGPRYGVAPAPG